MWHVGPPTHPSLNGDLRRRHSGGLIMSVRAPTQILGPLYFGHIGMMPNTNIIRRRPSLVSPLQEFQPLLQMPLEPQRNNRRMRTFRLFNDNHDEPYNRYGLRLIQPRDDIRPLFDQEMHSHHAEALIDNSSEEEIHIINPWARASTQTHQNHSSCQWNGTSTLRSNYYLQNHSESSMRDVSETVSFNTSSLLNPPRTTISSEAIDLAVEELSFDRNYNAPVLMSSSSFPNSNDPNLESPYVASDYPISNMSSTTDSLINTATVNIPENSHSLDTPPKGNSSSTNADLHPDQGRSTCTHCSSITLDESTTEGDNNLDSEMMMPFRTLSIPVMPQPNALARQIANKVIKHARDIKYPNERDMWCLNCEQFPVLPVTGQCGHTRCIKCIEINGACPCGVQAPETLHVNILIQDLIGKILPKDGPSRNVLAASSSVHQEERQDIFFQPSTSTAGSQHEWHGPERHRRSARSLYVSPMSERNVTTAARRQPMSVQARFKYAQVLLSIGRFREAAPHLAHVAASSEATPRIARTLLAQTVAILSQTHDPRRITRELFRSVRLHAETSWLKESDLECILCYHTFTKPVTTPCGHTFCRICMERSLDYRKTCALCLRSLHRFNLAATSDTTFVCAALASINALNIPSPPDPDVIPIFACTAAYPTIPCPLFIFDPRYWLMIRRVLESGSRKFGMVAYERDRTYSDFGTILEVRDCVQFEDGRSILSTVGVSRFRVIERDIREGCDVARIEPLTDITPTDDIVNWDLHLMAHQISDKAMLWLSSLNKTVMSDIETAFGQMPRFDHSEDWWKTPNGPDWLWWLIAILPLRSEIQVLMLSTKQLLKRMMAVSRTLEAVCDWEHVLINAEDWLQRT